MGSIQDKLAYLEETKTKMRTALEYKGDGDLSTEMYMAKVLGTETFRDFKLYIDKLDNSKQPVEGNLIYYDGINNAIGETGPSYHNSDEWQYWKSIAPGGVDGQLKGYASFDTNSLNITQDGDGLYVSQNYNINQNHNQFAIEIFGQITQSTGAIQKILSWNNCVEIYMEETEGVPKITASIRWYEPGYNEYIVRTFSAVEIEIGKPFYVFLMVGNDGYSSDYDKITQTLYVGSPQHDYATMWQSGSFVPSTFDSVATGNFSIGYTDDGNGNATGDYAKMKLYSFRLYNRYIRNYVGNENFNCLMRRFGFRDLLFSEGSYWIT